MNTGLFDWLGAEQNLTVLAERVGEGSGAVTTA